MCSTDAHYWYLFVTKIKRSRLTSFYFGDSKGIRTPVAAVRGLSLNRLTMEPYIFNCFP